MHLDKPCVHAFLAMVGDKVEHVEGLYLESGAANHMTRRGDAFYKLDRSVVGTVKFDDGLVVSIQGCVSVVFMYKGMGISPHTQWGGVSVIYI